MIVYDLKPIQHLYWLEGLEGINILVVSILITIYNLNQENVMQTRNSNLHKNNRCGIIDARFCFKRSVLLYRIVQRNMCMSRLYRGAFSLFPPPPPPFPLALLFTGKVLQLHFFGGLLRHFWLGFIRALFKKCHLDNEREGNSGYNSPTAQCTLTRQGTNIWVLEHSVFKYWLSYL